MRYESRFDKTDPADATEYFNDNDCPIDGACQEDSNQAANNTEAESNQPQEPEVLQPIENIE